MTELKHNFEDIIHSDRDGIFFKDIKGKYQLINVAAAKAVGKKVSDFIGKTDDQIFPKETAKKIIRMDKKVLKTKKTIKFEERVKVKGKQVDFETIKYPILDELGKPVFLCGIVSDVTQLKNDEEILAERMRELGALYQVSQDIDRIKNLNDLFKDVANIACFAMECSHPFFIIWLFDEKNKKQIKAFRGVENNKNAEKMMRRKNVFSVPLKVDSSKVGGFVVGYHNVLVKMSQAEKSFIKEVAALIGKEIERRKIKEDLQRLFVDMVKSFSSALDARDRYTVDHSKRMSDTTRLIAEKLRLTHKEREDIVLGSLLHDIGKIGISDKILTKPTRLTPEEFDRVKQHPLISERILKPIDALKGTLRIIRHHHERYDGKGYPDGLKGREIPIGARILTVCDAFDAMISERPYRNSLSIRKAVAELEKNAGTQFDPKVAKIMIKLVLKNQI